MKTRLQSLALLSALSFVLIFPVVAMLEGCATLEPGADPLVVRTEQAQKQTDATVDFVLGVDNADRGFWKTNAPAFHHFCETLRTPTPYANTSVPRVIAVQKNVQALKVQYKANRSAGNSNLLYQASSELTVLVSQALSWSNIITLPTH